MKKLIYVLPEYNSNLDGHIFYLANFVQELGKDLDIFLVIEKSKEKEVNLKYLSGVYVQRFSNPVLRAFEMFFVLLGKRLQWYDKAYVHYSYIGAMVSGLIMRLTGGKAFYWNCGMMWLFWKQPLLSLSLKMVHHLVTGVEALREGYSKHYGILADSIRVMPNWVELDRMSSMDFDRDEMRKSLGYSETDKIVLFVHRLAERKGIHYVTKIAEKLKSEANIKFLVIGDGPYRETFLREIKNWDLKSINYIGKVPNKEVYKYFLASDVFLMPSEEEGFPRVLIESMACNLPYVASDIGGVREISPEWEQKYIVGIGDVEGFSIKIQEILKEKFNFDEYVKQFDIKNVKNRFIRLIQD